RPDAGLAAVKADDGEIFGRHPGDGWDARRRSLGLVDAHVDEVPPAEEVERARAPLGRHPAGLPELDREARVREAGGEAVERRMALAARREPARHLEEDVGELPRVAERRQRRVEAARDLVLQGLGKIARIDAVL